MVPALLKGDAEFTLLDVPDAILDLQKWPEDQGHRPVSRNRTGSRIPEILPELLPPLTNTAQDQGDGTYDKLVNKYTPDPPYFPDSSQEVDWSGRALGRRRLSGASDDQEPDGPGRQARPASRDQAATAARPCSADGAKTRERKSEPCGTGH